MTSEGIVYMVRAKGTDHYKIGYTSQDVAKRVSSLQTGCPHELEAVATWPGTLDDESELHELLDEFRGIGEWFELTVADLVEFVREMVAEDEEVEVEGEEVIDQDDPFECRIHEFLSKHFVVDFRKRARSSDVFEQWCAWSECKGYRSGTIQWFGRRLNDLSDAIGFEKGRDSKGAYITGRVRQSRLRKQLKSSSVRGFVSRRCEVLDEYVAPTERLYDDYKSYCDEMGWKPHSLDKFGKDLSGLGYDSKRVSRNGEQRMRRQLCLVNDKACEESQDPSLQRTLSVGGAADITGFSAKSIVKQIEDGNLNAIDDDGYKVSRMDLQQWWADAGGGQLFSDLPAKDLQSYLKVVSDRTIEALQEKAERGEYTGGQPPYGYQVADDGVNLEPCEEEQRVISAIREYREAGLSLRKIAARLTERGFLNRSGRDFQSGSISCILKALDESA